MRFLFPVLTLLAVLLFALASLVSLALSFAVPALFLVLGVAVIPGSPLVGLRIIGGGFQALPQAFELVAIFVRCIFAPLSDVQALPDGRVPERFVRLQPNNFIQLHRMQQAIAAELGLKPVDELWLSPGTAIGIGEQKLDGKRVRFLVVGLGLVNMLSPEELRAVLAHEYGHARSGHLRLGRRVLHVIAMLIDAQRSFGAANPARWGALLACEVMTAIYLPWSRQREYDADVWAARIAGAEPLASALRKTRDHAIAYDIALDMVLQRAEGTNTVPRRLVECANALRSSIPDHVRRAIANRAEGDPLDLGGRTHPPIAQRIGALRALPSTTRSDGVPPIDAAAVQSLDERLSREWLRDFRGNALVTEEFLRDRPAGARPQVETGGGYVPTAMTSSGLELDVDRMKRK